MLASIYMPVGLQVDALVAMASCMDEKMHCMLWPSSIVYYKEQRKVSAVVAPLVQFGVSAVIEELDEEGKQLLSDAFEADPQWQKKGPPLFHDPGFRPGGRIVVELFQDIAPKAVDNFLCLCTGERGLGKASKKPLNYKVLSS
jgi:hypothetical protein